MLIISREQIGDLIRKLQTPSGMESGMMEVRRMIEIKEALAWRADAGIGGG